MAKGALSITRNHTNIFSASRTFITGEIIGIRRKLTKFGQKSA